MGRESGINKSISNSIWGVLDAAVYPAVYMAMIPVMMKGLGAAAFGLWIVLNTLMTTLQLFNLNIGLTTIKTLSSYAASEDDEQVNLAFNGILRITLLLIAAVCGVGVLIGFVLPYYNFLGIDAAVAGDILMCVLLSAVITGLKYLDQVFQSVLKAYELYKAAAILNLANRLGLLLVNVALAMSHASVHDLLVANVVFTLVYLLIHFVVIGRALPVLRLSFVKGWGLSRSIVAFSVWPWLQSIIVVIAFQTDRFWVSAHAGLTEVSSYGIVATMFNHIHMIFAAMTAWALPRISGMVARGHDPQQTYDQIRGMLFVTVITSLVLFNYCAPLLFTIWVGEETYRSMAVYIKAFTAFELLFAHTIMPFFYLNAAGKEREATRVTLYYSLACYALMVAGLKLFNQPLYMIHGMSMSLCISMPAVNYFVRKRLCGSASIREAVSEMIPAYLAILLIYLPQWWMGLLLLPAIGALVYKHYLSQLEEKLWKLPVKL